MDEGGGGFGEPAHTRLSVRILLIFAAIVFWLFATTAGHQYLHASDAGAETMLVASATGWMLATLFLSVVTVFAIWIATRFRRPGFRGVAIILFWMGLLAAGHAFSHDGLMDLAYFLKDAQLRFGNLGFALFVGAYALALAVPFFPGIEIGLAIIAMFGKTGALASYSATILGLMLAFFAGRRIPVSWRRAVFRYLRKDRRGKQGSNRRDSAPGAGRGPKRGLLPGSAARLLARYRYPGVGLALNIPGNSAVGGGGGIAMMCGMSRHFKTRWFFLTVCIATSPVPFLILTGLIDLEALMDYRGSMHDFLTALEPLFGLR